MLKFRLLFILLILSLMTNNLYCQLIIPKDSKSNVFRLKCKVNGESLFFIFDTGASNVSMSKKEFDELVKLGKISEKNIVGKVSYTIANGAKEEGLSVIIDTLEIEGLYLKNLNATIVDNDQAPLLLGMNVISQLGRVIIHNDKIVIDVKREAVKLYEAEIQSKITVLFDSHIKPLFKIFISKQPLSEFININHSYSYFSVLDTTKPIVDTAVSFDEEEIVVVKETEPQIEDISIRRKLFKEFIENLRSRLNKQIDISKIDFSSLNVYSLNVENNRFLITFNSNSKQYILEVSYIIERDSAYLKGIYLDYTGFIKSAAVSGYLDEIDSIQKDYSKSSKSPINIIHQYEKQISVYKKYENEFDSSDLKLIQKHFAEIAQLHYRAASYLYDEMNYQAVIQYATKAIDYFSNPDHQYSDYDKKSFIINCYRLRSQSKGAIGDIFGAFNDLKKIPESEYYYLDFRIRGQLKYFLNDLQGSIKDYNRAISLNPKDCFIYLHRGETKLKLKDIKGACLDLSRAGELGCSDAYKLINEKCNSKLK